MSRLVVYGLWPGNKAEDSYREIADLRNSWGGIAVICGKMFAQYVDGSGRYPDGNWLERGEELWPLYEREDIPVALRRCLAMCFDHAYVAREHFPRAAADLREFLAAFIFDPAHVNHLSTIAHIFETDQGDYPAISFNWTTVNPNPWGGSWKDPEDEDGDEVFVPYDWEQAWELYAHMDSMTGAAPDTNGGA